MIDDTFGELSWDPLLEGWLGGVVLANGLVLELILYIPEENYAGELALVKERWEWARKNEILASPSIAEEMRELYNDCWRDEEEPLSEEDFLRRMPLCCVTLYDDGSLRLSYDGRDLFGGHSIEGYFDAEGRFVESSLMG